MSITPLRGTIRIPPKLPLEPWYRCLRPSIWRWVRRGAVRPGLSLVWC